MALTTLQIIAGRNATLSAATTARDYYISDAEEQLDEAVYGDKYARAVALLAMHLYEKDQSAEASGAVTSRTEGGLSKSYGGGESNDDWMSTRWGKELWELTAECTGGTYVNRMM
jgi:hypothetical protein